MQKLLKFIAVIAILIVVPKIVQKAMGLDEKSQIKKQMVALVGDMNSKLPKDIGPGVTLTRVEFANDVFRNNYVLDASANFNIAQKGQYESVAVSQVCGGPTKEISKKGITIQFSYKYMDAGVEKNFDISVPPSKCA